MFSHGGTKETERGSEGLEVFSVFFLRGSLALSAWIRGQVLVWILR